MYNRRTDSFCLFGFTQIFAQSASAQQAAGQRGKAYLSVFTIDKGTAEIDLACLKQPVKDVKVIYPSTGDCTFEMEGTKLKVTFPAKTAARLFEIAL